LPLNALKGLRSFVGSYDSRTTKVFFVPYRKSHTRSANWTSCVF
jgi:hypothetical protein